MNRIQNENAKFLIKVLEENKYSSFDDETHNFYMNGKDEALGIKVFINRRASFYSEKFNSKNANRWFDFIVMAMNDFISCKNLHTIPSYRQIIYENLLKWCYQIADVYWDRNEAESLFFDILPPVSDPVVGLVKLLNVNGCSKKEIVTSLRVDEKTVRSDLKRLDIKNEGKLQPLRIGGQAVYLDVSIETREDKDALPTQRYKKMYYYKVKNTMHPFVMQYNVTQAAILMKSLYHYYSESFSTIAYKMAVDAWCQLSEYGRDRIKKVFGSVDKDFNNFLNDMDAAASGNKLINFTPEDFYLQEDSCANSDEQLMSAFKGGEVCRIIFYSDCNMEPLYGQRIMHDNKGFYAVPENEVTDNKHTGSSKKIYLNVEDIDRIIVEYCDLE